MRRYWSLLCVLLCTVVLLGGCSAGQEERLIGGVIDGNIPEGTEFLPISQVKDWEIEPALKIMRDPKSPSEGIAVTKFMFTSKSPAVLRNVHASIFLPDSLSQYTPMTIFGTNHKESRLTISPDQSKFGVGSTVHFGDFAQRDQVRQAFVGITRVKLAWNGGVRYIELPFERWVVEVDDSVPTAK